MRHRSMHHWPVPPPLAAVFPLAVVLVVAAASTGAAGPGSGRISWSGSRLVGTPDPPALYRTERVFENLRFKSPTVITDAPGSDRLFVVEQHGKIYSFRVPDDGRPPDLLLDLKAAAPGLSNAYGLAFHPGFEKNGLFFVCYVLGNGPDDTRVARFRLAKREPPRAEPASEETIITWLGGGHNGGCLKFSPAGLLYIATGDGTGPFPPDGRNTGQDCSDLLSSILRLDVDHADEGKLYRVPADNPFVGMEGIRPEIWAFGFRNPWKMSFDSVTGDLWTADVGWELWEMVYRVERGGNYGWSVTEGRQPVHPSAPRGPAPIILPPTVDHPHSEARSVTGGFVYRGERLKELIGAYVYGDYETGKIWELRHDGKQTIWHQELCDTRIKIAGFGEDREKELFLLDHVEGTIHRLVPNTEGDGSTSFPLRLSETGLFSDTPRQVPAPGVTEYSIAAEPWVDGAVARRFLALPGSLRIGGNAQRWEFPSGTVLAQTFSLDTGAGNGSLPALVETRLLHFDGEEWRGYSYEWDDRGEDATLVGRDGADRLRVVEPLATGAGGARHWRFASRSECLLCHNFFSGQVLGLRARQLDGARREGDGTSELDRLIAGGFLEPSLMQSLVEERQKEARRGHAPRWANPYDATARLDARARTYLDVNCACCHQRHGGGTSVIDVRYDIDLAKTAIVDSPPALGAFGIDPPRILTPGDPYRSVLYYRMATLGPVRMPHIGSHLVDERGLALIHDWIRQLPGEPETATVVEKLDSPANDGKALVDRLLGSTSGALRLLRLVDEGVLEDDVRELAISRASDSGLVVRGLFERFAAPGRQPPSIREPEPDEILALEGDARRGREIFEHHSTAQCRSCHGVEGRDDSVGPDLRRIGQKYGRSELLESILDPSRAIEPRYAVYVLQTRAGQLHSGLLLERSATEVVLKDARGEVTRVPAASVLALVPQKMSLMPASLLRGLEAQEAADLLEFLVSLR